MFEPFVYAVPVVIGAALYALGYKTVEMLLEGAKYRLSERGRKAGGLGGQWHACWQTTAEGQARVTEDVVELSHKGNSVTMSNVVHDHESGVGYYWKATLRLHDHQFLIGTYDPKSEGVTSRGALYLTIDALGRTLTGRWIGRTSDDPLATGFAAFARERDTARNALNRLMQAQQE